MAPPPSHNVTLNKKIDFYTYHALPLIQVTFSLVANQISSIYETVSVT